MSQGSYIVERQEVRLLPDHSLDSLSSRCTATLPGRRLSQEDNEAVTLVPATRKTQLVNVLVVAHDSRRIPLQENDAQPKVRHAVSFSLTLLVFVRRSPLPVSSPAAVLLRHTLRLSSAHKGLEKAYLSRDA